MPFLQNEGCCLLRADDVRVALENFRNRFLAVERQRAGVDGDEDARREPDQIVGVGQMAGLVEIVDAPGKPSLAVAPGAEILDKEVANRQRLRRLREIGAL